MLTDHDIEAEAQRMLADMQHDQYRNLRSGAVLGSELESIEVVREHLLNLLRELAAAREAMRWMPTNERMPATGTPVLTYDPVYAEPYRINAGVYCDEGDWVVGDEVDDKPTHWRPLPAPPPAATEGQR